MASRFSAAVTKTRRLPRTERGKDIEVTQANSLSKNVKVKKTRTLLWSLEEKLE